MPDVPCSNPECERTAFISPKQFRENPDGPYPCIKCYVPKNPTTGWMRKEYFKRGLDEKEYTEFMRSLSGGKADANKIDKWLQKKLGIDPKKDESWSSVNR